MIAFSDCWYWFVVMAVVSYLIGCFNFALLISKIKHNDVRRMGSGNPGTMNMSRQFGLKIGALTLFLDMLKGGLPVLAGYFIFRGKVFEGTDVLVSDLARYVCGVSVIVGHIYPVTMRFKGGKGIACIIGISLLAHPFVTMIAFAIGLAFLIFVKIGALASFIMIFTPNIYEAYVLGGTQPIVSVLIFVMLAIAVIAHHANIVRLFSGTENLTVLFRFGKNKK